MDLDNFKRPLFCLLQLVKESRAKSQEDIGITVKNWTRKKKKDNRVLKTLFKGKLINC